MISRNAAVRALSTSALCLVLISGQDGRAQELGLAGDSIRSLALDPNDPSTMYAGLFNGIVAKSTDGGVNWTEVDTILINDEISRVVPVSSSTLYVCSQSSGFTVLRSTNAGATWEFLPSDGNCDGGASTCGATGFRGLAATGGGTVIAGSNFGSPSSVHFNTGGTWFSSDYPSVTAQVLTLDPVDDTIVYAGSLGGGVYRSTNGGLNWSLHSDGIAPSFDVRDITFAPSSNTTVYASGLDGEVYRSSNSGGTWVSRNGGLPGSMLSETIAVDHSNPDVAYVGSSIGPDGRLYKTIDGGMNWTLSNVGIEDVDMRVILTHPTDSSIVYVGTTEGVFQSMDGGATWVNPPVAPPEPPTSSANYPFASSDADPVNTFTGELYNFYPADIDVGGPMPLRFERYYGAFLARSGVSGDLGHNWRHNFDAELVVVGTSATYVDNFGRAVEFTDAGGVGNWVQQNHLDTPYQLVAPPGSDGLIYGDADGLLRTFDLTSGGVLDGKLLTVEDGRGNVHTAVHNATTGDLETVSDGLGRTLTFTYNLDTTPKIDSVTDGTRTVLFDYTDLIDEDVLTEVLDLRGELTTYSYEDTSGSADFALMSSTTLPRSNVPFSQTFDAAGRVLSQTDGETHTTMFAYQGPDTTLTDPDGNTRIHTHSMGGEFSGRTDQLDRTFSMGSDGMGRRTSITDRLGGTTSWTYDTASGEVSSVTDPDGNTTSLTYTARVSQGVTMHDLTGITYADGETETRTYDAQGNLTAATLAGGETIAYTYNANGQVLTFESQSGGVVTNTYNGDGTLASSTDPATNTTTLGYDAFDRVDLITFADANFESATYDDLGNPLSISDENGNVQTFAYDANGNLASYTDEALNLTTFSYDDNDRIVSVEDPNTETADFTYDSLGRLATTTDETGNVTTYGYDELGRLTQVTDGELNVWGATYDQEGDLASASDPLGNTTSFQRDGGGRETSLTTPSGNVYATAYDARGRFISFTNPLGQATSFTRDANGRITNVDIAGLMTASYAIDASGQATGITDPNGNTWQRTWDSSGRLTSVTDPLSRTQTITYDNRNRVASVTYPGGMGSVTMSYDAVGNLTGQSFSDSTSSTYGFNSRNRVTTGSGFSRDYDARGQVSDTNGIAVTRDAAGRVQTMVLAPGKTLTYTYDGNGRVTQVTDWIGGSTTFTYDDAGRLTGMSRPNSVGLTQGWDADGQVSSVVDGTMIDIALTRDAAGQVVSAIRTVPQTGSAMALTSRSDTFDAAAQRESATYDALGRPTVDGSDSYTWNLASQLTGYSVAGATVSATYDAFGRRITRTEGGTTREIVWNDAHDIDAVSIERVAATDTRYFVYTPSGTLLYSVDAVTDARHFYHFDETGNTLAVTDDAGLTVATYAYTPFGEVISSTGSIDNPFTWQGQTGTMDEGSGLYYARARYYDSRAGRFLTRDPLKSLAPRNLNPYQYAWNNPVRFVDPTGRAPEESALVKALRAEGILGEKLNRPFREISKREPPVQIAPEVQAARARRARARAGAEFAKREAVRLHGETVRALESALQRVDFAISSARLDAAREALDDARVTRVAQVFFRRQVARANPSAALGEILAPTSKKIAEPVVSPRTTPKIDALRETRGRIKRALDAERSLYEPPAPVPAPAPTVADDPDSVVPQLAPLVVLA